MQMAPGHPNRINLYNALASILSRHLLFQRNLIVMKLTSFPTLLVLLILSTLYLPCSFAQDYTQWGLPEGAKARIGKGRINDMQYSPDGTILAVASSVGIWLYDAETFQELALLRKGKYGVRNISFSPDSTTLVSGDLDNDHYTVGC